MEKPASYSTCQEVVFLLWNPKGRYLSTRCAHFLVLNHMNNCMYLYRVLYWIHFSIILFYSHWGVPGDLFLSGFLTNILCIYHYSCAFFFHCLSPPPHPGFVISTKVVPLVFPYSCYILLLLILTPWIFGRYYLGKRTRFIFRHKYSIEKRNKFMLTYWQSTWHTYWQSTQHTYWQSTQHI